jgi:hypothetical protein
MINLMPPEAKSAILYARLNARLFKWTIGSLIIIAIMGATVVLGSFYIDNAKHSLASSIAQTKKTISDQKLDQVQTEAANLSSGVKLIVQVLSKEVLFSKLLQQIGNIMPTGATLGDIQLSNKVTGAIDLTANAVDYQSATQVQVNLEDPKNNLFDKVDTQSVTCGTSAQNSDGTVSKYKCQIIVRALFKPNASVTFLANPPSGAQQ